MAQQTVSLSPRGPYGFGLVLAYLRSSPSAIVERVSENGFQRALDIGPGVVVSVHRQVLLPSTDPLTLTITAERLTSSLIEATTAHVRRLLCLDVDGHPIEGHLARHDPALGTYVQQYRGFRPVLLGSPWEALLWAVSGQLVSVEQARGIKQRLVQQGQRAVQVADTHWPLPPDPTWVLQSGVDTLRILGLSRTKAQAIYTVADAVTQGTLDLSPGLAGARVASALDQLETIPGIGPWTRAMVALRGYGQLDVIPDGDAGLQTIVARHSFPTTERLTAQALRAHAARWAPYRGWATYLWWLQLQAEALARRANAAYERGRRQ